MGKKRVMTVDDLLAFVKEQRMSSFSSKENGFTLAVQMPGVFRFTADDDRRGLRKFESRAFHDHVNLNRTNIETEVFKDKIETAGFRPVLANIVMDSAGQKDFGAHDFHVEHDEDGKEIVIFDERPIGVIDGSQTRIEYDEDAEVNRAILSGFIFEEYCPDAIEIFERRGGEVDNSVELTVEAFSYDAKKQALTFTDYYVSGLTLLGAEHQPGMAGSSMTLESATFEFQDDGFNAILDKFNDILSKFENLQKGGETVSKFEELLQKYGKTAEDITFEHENMSDEELEAAFEAAFATQPETAPESQPEPQTGVVFSAQCGEARKEFSLSLSDKISAVYELINATYADDWYGVDVYEDDGYVDMYGWCFGKNYRQSFTVEDDVYTLTGDRVEIFARYLTQEELDSLESMKSNYAALEQYKNDKEAEIARADKMSALVGYSAIENTDEYKALLESIDKYSKEELIEKADAIVGKCARQGMQFSFEATPKSAVRVAFSIQDDEVASENVKSYSGLFDD
jgi:hypothetical protein